MIIAADMMGSYGSLARFRSISRLLKVNDTTMLGASGDYADFQYLITNAPTSPLASAPPHSQRPGEGQDAGDGARPARNVRLPWGRAPGPERRRHPRSPDLHLSHGAARAAQARRNNGRSRPP